MDLVGHSLKPYYNSQLNNWLGNDLWKCNETILPESDVTLKCINAQLEY